jgi:hypothetical protein
MRVFPLVVGVAVVFAEMLIHPLTAKASTEGPPAAGRSLCAGKSDAVCCRSGNV